MPLFTDDIEQARVAYSVLEGRTQSAEQLAQTLQAALDDLKARQPVSFELAQAIRQRALDREADNAKLQTQVQNAVQASADLPLQNFIAAVGLAGAIGEATMPDRAIGSISATVQTHLSLAGSAVGLRFFQPGIGVDPGSLSSTTFEIAKVPPPPDATAPRSLYSVLEDKQVVYTNSFWSRFNASGPPPSRPPAEIIVAIATVLANTGRWNFSYLLQSALAIGSLEKTLSSLISAALPGDSAAAYSVSVDSLLALTKALSAKDVPVAGDLLALTASLDNTTALARTLLP